jgi:uncharacterized SAM-binding protein YcdF (DUF218 family)
MSARIIALFLSLLTLGNLVLNCLWPGFDANIWWISFAPLPAWLVQPMLAVCAFALLRFALRRSAGDGRSPLVAGTALLLAIVALANAAGFYRLLAEGRIAAGFPVPLSFLVCLGMLLIARTAWSPHSAPVRFARWRVVAGGLALFALFPLALMLFFGNTDYRRRADVAVVFGARAYRDGRLSNALEDRMRTACALYHERLVKRLVLSGGPGDGAVTEAEAMRRYAVSHGVRVEDILLDDQGLNTEATVRDTVPLFNQWRVRRVLAVSHFYHLPRIKLAYQRAGVEVCTVPARQARLLSQLPFNLAREVAAFWSYYLRQPAPVVTSVPGRA